MASAPRTGAASAPASMEPRLVEPLTAVATFWDVATGAFEADVAAAAGPGPLKLCGGGIQDDDGT